jgi:hypothetical protein
MSGARGVFSAESRRHGEIIRQEHEWPRAGGAIGKNRGVRHSVEFSIGERRARGKLLEEISLPSLLKAWGILEKRLQIACTVDDTEYKNLVTIKPVEE